MAGIYITSEKQKEIEEMITSNRRPIAHYDGIYVSEVQQARAELLEEILSDVVVLPVEESWIELADEWMAHHYELNFPNGIIIKPK